MQDRDGDRPRSGGHSASSALTFPHPVPISAIPSFSSLSSVCCSRPSRCSSASPTQNRRQTLPPLAQAAGARHSLSWSDPDNRKSPLAVEDVAAATRSCAEVSAVLARLREASATRADFFAGLHATLVQLQIVSRAVASGACDDVRVGVPLLGGFCPLASPACRGLEGVCERAVQGATVQYVSPQALDPLEVARQSTVARHIVSLAPIADKIPIVASRCALRVADAFAEQIDKLAGVDEEQKGVLGTRYASPAERAAQFAAGLMLEALAGLSSPPSIDFAALAVLSATPAAHFARTFGATCVEVAPSMHGVREWRLADMFCRPGVVDGAGVYFSSDDVGPLSPKILIPLKIVDNTDFTMSLVVSKQWRMALGISHDDVWRVGLRAVATFESGLPCISAVAVCDKCAKKRSKFLDVAVSSREVFGPDVSARAGAEVEAFSFDRCRVHCSSSRLHMRSRLVLAMQFNDFTTVLSEAFVTTARAGRPRPYDSPPAAAGSALDRRGVLPSVLGALDAVAAASPRRSAADAAPRLPGLQLQSLHEQLLGAAAAAAAVLPSPPLSSSTAILSTPPQQQQRALDYQMQMAQLSPAMLRQCPVLMPRVMPLMGSPASFVPLGMPYAMAPPPMVQPPVLAPLQIQAAPYN
eukprot:m51a1_g8884 hypothetical protein (641) ;mRNA; r:653982-657524